MDAYESRPRDRIAEQIECYIIENNLKPGDTLPSERQLCEAWNCNRMTFRAAAKRLIAAGILASTPLENYYIPEPRMLRNLQDLGSFTDWVKSQGKTLKNRRVSQSVIKTSARMADRLQLPINSQALQIVRVRLIDDEPVALDTSIIPLERYPGIETYDFEGLSLYGMLHEEYGVEISHGTEDISLTFADEIEADLLQIAEGSACYFLNGISYDTQNVPVESFKSIARTDKMKFISELGKEERK